MTERTFAMIKSCAVSQGHADEIVARIKAAGIRIVESEEGRLTKLQAEGLYAEHAGRPYFDGLLNSVTDPGSGVVVMVLEGEGVIARWREMLGATDPALAAVGTIRHDFGTRLPNNAAHGSDSAVSAAREIALIFPGTASA